MTRSAAAFAVAFALGPMACSSQGSPPDGGGVCHSAKESCTANTDCCAGFSCVGGFCSFTGSEIGGETGGETGGTSGSAGTTGSTSQATTGSGSSGSTGGASSGSSGGGSGGCAGFGDSCQSAPCCNPYDGGLGYVCLYGSTCEQCQTLGSFCDTTSDCCSGSVCAGGVCSVATDCELYDVSCATTPCCTGYTCDPSATTCYVADGGSCVGGETCASPFSCLPTGVCGIPVGCSGYGDFCGTTACCSGLSCDPTYQFCYVETGSPCQGRLCAPPDTCLASGACGAASGCSPYGTSCATTPCCTGLTCDATSKQCSVADGGPCAFTDGGATIEFCAPPFSCLTNGTCGIPVPCGGYGESGCSTAGANCCPGFACDSTYDACYDAPGASCTGIDTYCANGGTCNDAGVCGGAATCEAYGLACGTLGCCAGLTCDATYDACYDALGSSCVGTDSYCANGNVCSSGVCAPSSSCGVYGDGCDSISCCTGLTCDEDFDVCYIAAGYDCLDETCATPDTCIADVCQ